MTQHLSAKEISRWIAGRPTAAQERHIQRCAECSAEVARAESGLAAFRHSIREWAQTLETPPVSIASWAGVENRPRSRRHVWGLAAAAVALAVGVPIYRESQLARVEATRQRDAELLEQVETQLSRAVPASMEPLMELMYEEREEP